MIYEIEKKILNYYVHLQNLPESTIAKQALKISESFPSSTPSLLRSINELRNKYSLPNTTEQFSTYVKKSMKNIKNKMLNNYIGEWIKKVNNSSKLKFYNSIKHNYLQETYIDHIKNPKHRQILSKFRLSNHTLEIETGRYNNPPVPAEKRTCLLCENSEIEDENHFLLYCKTFSLERKSFYDKILKTDPAFIGKTDSEKITHLFETNDKNIQSVLAKYIYDCFILRTEKRSIKLSTHTL